MTKINLLAPRVPPLGAKRIPLTQDQVTLVSAEDFDRLNQHSWYATWNPSIKSFYARRTVRRGGKRIYQYLHREILGLDPGDPREVHHINGNPLDNRRSNLKVVTRLEHRDEDRDNPRKDVSTYGIGVYRTRAGRFESRARIDGKKRHGLGTFDTPEEAQKARQDFLTNRREEAHSV